VLDAAGSGSGSQIIEGIQYCANQADVQIISMSLGTTCASDGQDAMSLAVNCASDSNYRASCNVTPINPKIVVVAAGNSGSAPGTIGALGAAEKAITVGAAANWSEDGKGVYLAAFSSRGPTLEGRIKPDITAPGVRILSAKASDPTGYISYSGTSMATPFTAGSIALMLEQNPLLMNNAAPVDAVRDLLISSAQDRGELSNNGPIMPDNEYGAGLLDVNRAVAQAGGGDTAPTLFPRYHRYKEMVNNGSQQLIGPFSITTEDIVAGIPFAATVTIEGNLICAWDQNNPQICDILGGWEWNPDLDMYLLDDKGNIISGGSGDITRSECALSG
jgi:serine protease AprX